MASVIQACRRPSGAVRLIRVTENGEVDALDLTVPEARVAARTLAALLAGAESQTVALDDPPSTARG